MNKPDQIFIWHCGSELPEVYRGFRDAFAGPKGGIQLRLYDPEDDDPEDDVPSVTRDDIIPNAVKRSQAIIFLLTGKENVDKDLVHLFEAVANAPYQIALSLAFLYPEAKEWWFANIEPKIESLRSQFLDAPVELWSKTRKPAVLTGETRDSVCVGRVEGLRRSIESKVRALTAFKRR